MKLKVTLVCILLALTFRAHAAVKLPGVFSDHMVLQRDAAAPIWGTAEALAEVTVSFADQQVSTHADRDGAWRVELKPLAASAEPRSLSVQSGNGDPLVLEDVLVGDVWLGSGQSNMAGRVTAYAKNDETLAALVAKAPFPQIRLMQGGPSATWTLATAESVPAFSALLFPFGERLQRELDVPIGLIVGAVGGTPSGFWIPPDTYANSEKCQAAVAEFAKTWNRNVEQQRFETQLAAWEKQVEAAKAKGETPRGRKPLPPAEPGGSIRGGKIGNLYERFIAPVAGYRIRGVLWDQGEARSGVRASSRMS